MKNKVNRRDFLKSSTVIGTASMGAGAGVFSLASCSNESRSTPELSYVTPPNEVGVIQTLENDFLKVHVYNNAVLEVFDKKTNHVWKTFTVSIQDEKVLHESMLWNRRGREMGEQYPGRFIGEKIGDSLKFKLYARQNEHMGTFTCQYKLDNEWLKFELLEIGDELPSLVFPPPFKTPTLVLPYAGGTLVQNGKRHPYSGIFSRTFMQFFDRLSMRMFGGLDGENGWLCAFEPTAVDSGGMLVNGQITPVWVRSMGKWQGNYKVSYCFTGNNYVGIAKQYRKFAIEKGFFKSLKEKIEENPEVAKLIGGRALQFMNYHGKAYPDIEENYWYQEKMRSYYDEEKIHFTFNDVKEKVKYAEDHLGFNKGMVLLRGWMHDGYDATHPDIWPIETKLGSEEELKEIMGMCNKYVTALHDNYQDFYPVTPSFPKGVVVRENGRLMSGGLWFGHQCYMTNARDGAKYAARNWEDVKTLGSSGYFVDCVACNPLHESYEKGNELTRVQAMQGKYDILKVFYDDRQVVGSEYFGDFCVPVMHWSEHKQRRVQGQTIPLWQLVFHDAVLGCRYNSFSRNRKYPDWLEDMLYGNFLRFWVPGNFGTNQPYDCSGTYGWGGWEYTKEEFKNTYHVDKWHEKIALSDMTSHKFLTDDMKVEEVIYDNTYRITVNFDDKARTVDGKTLKPFDYILEG